MESTNIDIKQIVMHARGERHQSLFYAVSQQGANEVLVFCLARWEEHQKMLIIPEQKNQQLCQSIHHISKRQELLAAQMERMKILQRDAPEEFHKQIFQGNQGFRRADV